MSEKQQNLQDTFLNAVRKSKSPVTIFLVNGVKLQGNITWFDNFCVLLRRDGQAQLVYKHAISTVMPMGPIQLDEYGKPVLNVYIRKVERKDGQLVNTIVETFRDVSQFWTYDAKQFLAAPQYARDIPPAKNLE